MNTVDIIVPCYNEEEGLSVFYQETQKVLDTISNYQFTFLLINDGSRDGTLDVMKTLAAEHANVKFLSFSRNFGKEAAMYAGLTYSVGDLVIIMDADLQHPPAMIPDMLGGIEEGYDCCAARRSNREGESKIRSAFSNLFYKLSNRMTDVRMAQGAVDFRIMTRQVVDSILKLSEVERFSKGIFAWVGFNSFRGLFKYAIDGITSFSISPLRLVTGMGCFISLFAFLYIVITLVKTMITGIDVPGYVTLLSAVLFLGGIIELSIGILGEYIAHIYMEAKDRPIFIVKETNLDRKNP